MELTLDTNGNITNDAIDSSANHKVWSYDIQGNRRDYTTSIGADEIGGGGSIVIKQAGSEIKKYDFGTKTSSGSVTLNVYNPSGSSAPISSVTATLIDNAGAAYSISGCSGGTINPGGFCNLYVNYATIAVAGLKRGVIEITADGVASKSVIIEATNTSGTLPALD